jgi:hypothetical protein
VIILNLEDIMNLYRLMRVKNVRETSDQFYFSMEDSIVIFVASKEFLRSKKIESIIVGQEFFIKGRLGNNDVMLAQAPIPSKIFGWANVNTHATNTARRHRSAGFALF